MSEPLQCPECGEDRMVRVVENCRLNDGLTVRRLAHFKCLSCQSRFFDDAAMRRIQIEREKHGAVRP
jgi:transposase-like protein